MTKTKRLLLLPLLAVLSVLAGCSDDTPAPCPDCAPITVSESELKEAFYYTFPLMIMEATEAVETNAETFVPGTGRAPINQLNHAMQLADASSTSVVTPNVDTYYSRLWLDVADEPIVFEFPDVKDRFCNMQVLDAWTNTTKLIAEGGTYVFALKGQRVDVPSGATLVEMPTAMGWCIARVLNKGEGDYEQVKLIQDAMKVYPLSAYGDEGYVAPKGTYDAAKEVNPVEQCMAMPIEEYFAKANRLMEKNPPMDFDGEIIGRLSKLGVGPGLEPSPIDNGAAMFDKIKAAFKADAVAIAAAHKKSIGGIWSYFDEPIGDFGKAYDYRAAVALVGLGANTNEVAIYPRTDNDSSHAALDGANRYTLRFSSLPPVMEGGFWSITAYGDNDYLIDNPIDRYNITDRSPFKLNADGTLDVTLSAVDPDDGSYWLPTGGKGFHLFMRMYLPDLKAMEGWEPPTITKK